MVDYLNMSQALYRKWRPARFNEIVGQQHITRTLQNAVAAGRIGHAYLFSGPRGTGKTTTARILAKAANCDHRDQVQRPCNVCSPCIAVNEGRFLDLIEIDAASNTGVDDIRDLREKISFSPSEGRFKVYIIDEVHMLSTAAFNALLKTLEEPPAHAIFILATTEEHKVPLTIKSRCQPFTFRLLTFDEIRGRLQWMAQQEDLQIAPQALDMIAHHGAGSLRDAESLLDQLVSVPGDQITLERAQLVLGTAPAEAITGLTDAWLEKAGSKGLEIIHNSLASGADARQFARQMVIYLRNLLLYQTAGQSLELNVTTEQKDELDRQAKLVRRQHLITALKRFNEAATAVTGSWQPQLPLELAFIEAISDHGDVTNTYEVGEVDDDADAADANIVREKSRRAPPYQPDENIVVEEGIDQPIAIVDSTLDNITTPDSAEEVSFRLKDITRIWPKLREEVGQTDRNLPALLASSKPLATEGRILILGFDFPILKEKFDAKPHANDIVAEALSNLLNSKCLIRTVVTDQYVTTEQATVERADIEALAEELGGVLRNAESK